ncbi:response regulator [Archangium violaceum]|uniref:response regulator n=1 Tax=Archangium violaceum TaxID=83451 RepID=UPI00194E662A|nr:response regulator [Archangium violaceum]QRO00306.1 response regulator [Archangium violaceum]
MSSPTALPRVDVLTVDDTPANLRSLEVLMADLGANVVTASSGDEALRLLLDRDFALILLDVQMPGMDGYETASLIRMRERTRHIPIIFITAYTRSEVNVTRGYELGAVDYLFKPIVPEVLRTKVAVFLDLHRKKEEVRRQAELLRQAENREHERQLAEARSHYERSLLEQEMERERKVSEAREQRAQELARLVQEKEQAQSALHESNARLRLLADTASRLLKGTDGRTLLDGVHGQLTAHMGLEVCLGYLVQEGRGALELATHAGIPAAMLPRLEHLEPGQGVAGRVVAENQRWVLDGGAAANGPLPDAAPELGLSALACYPLISQGRVLGTLAFGTRTMRVFSPDELSLMQGVCDQVAVALERERLIGALREADRRKDEFLAMLAHELRNPLAPVRHALEVFRMRMWQDDIIQRAISSADRQVAHMTRLVDDLLDVSRITRGKVELKPIPVSLTELVEGAVQACEPIISQRHHELSVSLPSEQVTLNVDPTRMTQVVANLLHNAAKYTPSGGQIHLRAERQGEELMLSVRDNGIGLKPEMLHRVFELFVQVDPGSDRAQGGLGLGLTLVRSLVEMHGGSVSARSEGPSKGSEFTVRLPLPPEIPAAISLPSMVKAAASLNKLQPLHILLVEDNPDIRETLKDLLELHGHRVEEASDGRSAVDMVLSQRPQVALVDIGLPELDGYKVAELVRASAGGSTTRLVALTGYGHPEDRKRALEAGFDAHLVKPVSSDDLSQVLKKLCTAA